jgi:hypothetical protein
MKHALPRRLASSIAATIVGLAIMGLSPGSALAETTSCSSQLSQPFLSSGDQNWYAPVSGQTGNNFTGSGWTLSGGAKVVTVEQADGQSAGVLELPTGSKAVSPVMCVTSDYPTARMMIRDLSGPQGVFFYVSYANTPTWENPKNTGQVHGSGTAWTLSTPINLQPVNGSGWQQVKFTLVPTGAGSKYQIYDFYVDPRMH